MTRFRAVLLLLMPLASSTVLADNEAGDVVTLTVSYSAPAVRAHDSFSVGLQCTLQDLRSPDFGRNWWELGRCTVRIDHLMDRHIPGYPVAASVVLDFSDLDQAAKAVEKLDVSMWLSLGGVPAYLRLEGVDELELDLYAELVGETVRHCGLRGLQATMWEIPCFVEPADFAPLYARLACAVRDVQPHARIGAGIRLADMETLRDILAVWRQQEVPCDFVAILCHGIEPASYLDAVRRARQVFAEPLEDDRGKQPDLFVVETDFADGRPENDGPYAATALVHTLRALEQERVAGAALCAYRDPSSATGRDFWGARGLLTANGLKKASYFALAAHSGITPHRVPVKLMPPREDIQARGCRIGNGLYVTVCRFDPRGQGSINLEALIDGIPQEKSVTLDVGLIDETHSNVFADPSVAAIEITRIEVSRFAPSVRQAVQLLPLSQALMVLRTVK